MKLSVLAGALIVAAVVVALYYGAPFYVRGSETVARVVDSESGAPVAGASVQVTAYLSKPYLFHGGESRVIFSYATSTDNDGRFTIPAWGPVRVWRGWYYEHFGPSLRVEKDGYKAGEFGRYRDRNDPPSATYPFGTVATNPEWNERNLFLAQPGHHHRAPWDNELYRLAYPNAPQPGLTIKSSK